MTGEGSTEARDELASYAVSRLPRARASIRAFASSLREAPLADKLSALVMFVFALVCLWGVGAPRGEGHLGDGLVANVLVGENAFRWRHPYPSWLWFTNSMPPEAQWICSHPYGMLWLAGGLAYALGHANVVAVLPAVLMSSLTPTLLWGMVRKVHGEVGALFTVVGFCVLPITMGFAQFQSLEVFVMFGCALFGWGHMHFIESGRTRYLVASGLGVAFAALGDWAGYLYLGPMLAWGFLRGFVLPRRMTAKVNADRYARAWAWGAATAAACGLVTLFLLYKGHRIECLLQQATRREGPNKEVRETLAEAFTRRAAWIEASFTPLPVGIGRGLFFLALARAAWFRRDEEVAPLAALAMAVIQYVAFPQGADVHPFWPHYFALYYALALGQLGATLNAAPRWLSRVSRGRFAASGSHAVWLVPLLVYLVAVVPDAARCTLLWRAGAGTMPAQYPLNRELSQVLRQVVRPRIAPGQPVAVDPTMPFGAAQSWATLRPVTPSAGGPARAPRNLTTWIALPRNLSGAECKQYAMEGKILAVGELWLAQPGAVGPLEAWRVEERKPTLWTQWLRTETEPEWQIKAELDPWRTWELRAHFGQAPLPDLPEDTDVEALRVRHNAAVLRGDALAADGLAAALRGHLASQPAQSDATFEVLGVRRLDYLVPVAEVWVRVRNTPAQDLSMTVTSTMVRPWRWSLIQLDPNVREFRVMPTLPTSLWRPQFIYALRTPLRSRAGVEAYTARIAGASVSLGEQ